MLVPFFENRFNPEHIVAIRIERSDKEDGRPTLILWLLGGFTLAATMANMDTALKARDLLASGQGVIEGPETRP